MLSNRRGRTWLFFSSSSSDFQASSEKTASKFKPELETSVPLGGGGTLITLAKVLLEQGSRFL